MSYLHPSVGNPRFPYKSYFSPIANQVTPEEYEYTIKTDNLWSVRSFKDSDKLNYVDMVAMGTTNKSFYRYFINYEGGNAELSLLLTKIGEGRDAVELWVGGDGGGTWYAGNGVMGDRISSRTSPTTSFGFVEEPGVFTIDNSAQETLRTTSDNRVGILTTEPEFDLHVAGDVGVTNGNLYTSKVLPIPRIESTFMYFGPDSNEISFSTNNLTRLIIKSTGNVGIGLDDPLVRLDVKGDIANETLLIGDNVIKDRDTPGTFTAYYDGKYEIYTNSSPRITVLENGNVGVNTISPSYKLHVVGDISNDTLILKRETIYNKDYPTSYLSFLNGDYRFFGESIPRMIILKTGNVGVGTGAPLRLFHVNGDIRTDKILLEDNTITSLNQTGLTLSNVDRDTRMVISATKIEGFNNNNSRFTLASSSSTLNYSDNKFVANSNGVEGLYNNNTRLSLESSSSTLNYGNNKIVATSDGIEGLYNNNTRLSLESSSSTLNYLNNKFVADSSGVDGYYNNSVRLSLASSSSTLNYLNNKFVADSGGVNGYHNNQSRLALISSSSTLNYETNKIVADSDGLELFYNNQSRILLDSSSSSIKYSTHMFVVDSGGIELLWDSLSRFSLTSASSTLNYKSNRIVFNDDDIEIFYKNFTRFLLESSSTTINFSSNKVVMDAYGVNAYYNNVPRLSLGSTSSVLRYNNNSLVADSGGIDGFYNNSVRLSLESSSSTINYLTNKFVANSSGSTIYYDNFPRVSLTAPNTTINYNTNKIVINSGSVEIFQSAEVRASFDAYTSVFKYKDNGFIASSSAIYTIMDGDNVMVVNSNGRVGIGTNTPQYNLHVIGSFKCDTITTENMSSSEEGAVIKYYTNNIVVDSTGTEIFYNNETRFSAISNSSIFNYDDNKIVIDSDGIEGFYDNNSRFLLGSSSSTLNYLSNKIVLDSSGTDLFYNNVSRVSLKNTSSTLNYNRNNIILTSSGIEGQYNNRIRFSLYFASSTLNYNDHKFMADEYGTEILYNNISRFAASSSSTILNYGNNRIRADVSGVELFYNSLSRLSIESSSSVFNYNTNKIVANSSGIELFYDNDVQISLNEDTSVFKYYDNGLLVSENSIFMVMDNVDALFINSDRNIGIGTTNPEYKLDVNGSLRCTSFTVSNESGALGDSFSVEDDGTVVIPSLKSSTIYTGFIRSSGGNPAIIISDGLTENDFARVNIGLLNTANTETGTISSKNGTLALTFDSNGNITVNNQFKVSAIKGLSGIAEIVMNSDNVEIDVLKCPIIKSSSGIDSINISSGGEVDIENLTTSTVKSSDGSVAMSLGNNGLVTVNNLSTSLVKSSDGTTAMTLGDEGLVTINNLSTSLVKSSDGTTAMTLGDEGLVTINNMSTSLVKSSDGTIAFAVGDEGLVAIQNLTTSTVKSPDETVAMTFLDEGVVEITNINTSLINAVDGITAITVGYFGITTIENLVCNLVRLNLVIIGTSSNAMHFKDTGRVGVDAPDPRGLFDVNGDLYANEIFTDEISVEGNGKFDTVIASTLTDVNEVGSMRFLPTGEIIMNSSSPSQTTSSDVEVIGTFKAGTGTIASGTFTSLSTSSATIANLSSGRISSVDNILFLAGSSVGIFAGSDGSFYANGFIKLSDYRLKEDVMDLDETECLRVIRGMKPRTYYMKDDESKRKNWGLIAQELEEYIPEAVKRTKGKIKTVRSLAIRRQTASFLYVEKGHDIDIEVGDTAVTQFGNLVVHDVDDSDGIYIFDRKGIPCEDDTLELEYVEKNNICSIDFQYATIAMLGALKNLIKRVEALEK